MLNKARNLWMPLFASALIALIALLLLFPSANAPATGANSVKMERLLPASDIQDYLLGEKPNIVLIVTDDQPVGYETYMPKTMRLFREEGVRFTNAHSLNSTCCPARSTLLTGKNSPSTGVWTNWAPEGGWEAFYQGRWEGRTLATALDRRGYRTALVGKYLNGYDSAETRTTLTGNPTYVPPGWDVWFGRVDGRDGRGTYYDYGIVSTDENSERATLTYYGNRLVEYSTDVLGEKAIDIINSTPAQTPLFLMWTPVAPHSPFIAKSEEKVSPKPAPPASLNNTNGKPPWIADRNPITAKKSVAFQEAQIRTLGPVDTWVENMANALKSSGRWDNTLFIFVSDNGLFVGEYGLLGMKNHPHPASTNVPLMIASPGLREVAGATDGRLVTLADISATIASVAGLDATALDGQPLTAPISTWKTETLIAGWRNRGKEPAGNQPSYCAWRTEEWLFIQYSADANGEGYRELYNLKKDPTAVVNVAGSPDTALIEDELALQTQAECRPAPPDFTWPDKIIVPLMPPSSP